MKTECEEIAKEKEKMSENYCELLSMYPWLTITIQQGQNFSRKRMHSGTPCRKETKLREKLRPTLKFTGLIFKILQEFQLKRIFTVMPTEGPSSLSPSQILRTTILNGKFTNPTFPTCTTREVPFRLLRSSRGVRQSFTESDRQRLIVTYEEVRNRGLSNDPKLEGYRRSLLTDYERELQRHRIGFSQREIRGEDAQMILGRQNEFFRKLKAVDVPEDYLPQKK